MRIRIELELKIRSVLTTQVINWCRSCVRELDLARRLVYFACTQRTLPKHLEPDLVLLRDPRLREQGETTLAELAERISVDRLRAVLDLAKLRKVSPEVLMKQLEM